MVNNDPFLAYGQSKTANILFAVEANNRWASDGITANTVHPGAIFDTDLTRHMDGEILGGLRASAMYFKKTISTPPAPSTCGT